jgi:hypothetical protein
MQHVRLNLLTTTSRLRMTADSCHCGPAGKYRTAAVTKEGDVFMWEGWSQPLHAGSGASGRLGTPQLPPAPPPGSSPGTSASLQVHPHVAAATMSGSVMLQPRQLSLCRFKRARCGHAVRPLIQVF